MKTIVVSKKTWCRGFGSSALLTSSGKMCCLGFLAAQCGVPASKTLSVDDPDHLSATWSTRCRFTKALADYGAGVWERFVAINDAGFKLDRTRMRDLRELAKKFGFRFSFTK